MAPAGTGLDAGQRLVTAIGADWYPGIEDLTRRLPPWLNDTQLDADEPWSSELADFGLSGPPGVQVEYSDGVVGVTGPVGRRILDVQTPRGLSRVPLEWVPGAESVLHAVASEAVTRGGGLEPRRGGVRPAGCRPARAVARSGRGRPAGPGGLDDGPTPCWVRRSG